MAKHRFQRTRKMPTTRLALLAVLILGFGASPSWAGQQSAKNSRPSTKTAPATGPEMAKTPPAKSARTSAQRKAKSVGSHGSELAEGRRDPFRLPEVSPAKVGGRNMIDSAPGGVLPPGARGLLISQLKLEGVVREQTANKMIAVVTNETKRAYFLTENESVYNGVVSKITPDAVYFTENVLGPNGRVSTREVVKRLGPASGEGR